MRLRRHGARSTPIGTAIHGLHAITGGLGGLGLRAAVLLVGSIESQVILASRSGRVVHNGQGLEGQLQSLGSAARVVACNNAASRDASALMSAGLPVGELH